jgi:fucose 4-O-acetylase-like acetyltransferase
MCSLRPQKEKGSGHPSPHQSRKQSQFSAKYCKTVPCNFSSLPFLPVVPTVPLQTHSCSLCVGSVFADVPQPFFTVASPADAHRRATSLPLSLLNHLLAYLHTWASGSLRTCKWFSNSRCNLQFTFFLCSTHSALLRSTAGREKEGASDMSTATSTYTHSTKNLMSSVHICNDVFSYALQLAERPSHTTTGAPAWLS